MKPLPSSQARSPFPVSPNYLAGRREDFSGGGSGRELPSFRGISEQYFKTEARRHFASEATVLALIVITAAVPVVQSLRGLAAFIHGVS